jgi:hypothetical protein
MAAVDEATPPMTSSHTISMTSVRKIIAEEIDHVPIHVQVHWNLQHLRLTQQQEEKRDLHPQMKTAALRRVRIPHGLQKDLDLMVRHLKKLGVAQDRDHVPNRPVRAPANTPRPAMETLKWKRAAQLQQLCN